jgi:hypothetical protein
MELSVCLSVCLYKGRNDCTTENLITVERVVNKTLCSFIKLSRDVGPTIYGRRSY